MNNFENIIQSIEKHLVASFNNNYLILKNKLEILSDIVNTKFTNYDNVIESNKLRTETSDDAIDILEINTKNKEVLLEGIKFITDF